MRTLNLLTTLALLLPSATAGFCQTAAAPWTLPLSADLPLDTLITCGRLENGITYYIRRNQKPEHRAELRLVVNAGSILENDSQQGLAHFVEHMAFNGTRDFRKQDIVNYLESIGVRFGADLNAYTSFDETVYMLEIPTDTPAIVEKGFEILENWAHLVTFGDEEIDKERGVITEEWRLGRGAEARIRDKQFPVIFKDSRYAERLPIGKLNVVEHAPHDTLREFYRDWYRPDLMAVIAVGDFDKAGIESLIRNHFSVIPARTAERPRRLYPVPGTRGTLYTIATDPEATLTRIAIYFKHAVKPEATVGDYRRSITEALYSALFNERLDELSRKADPPFLYAYTANQRIVRTKESYTLAAVVKNSGAPRGLETLMTEALRVKKFGFTPTELDREKKDMLRSMENAYEERNKTESQSFASEYIRNFLVGEPSPGIASEYELYKRFLPDITLAEVNALTEDWIRQKDDRVVTLSAPQKEGVAVPTSEALARAIESVNAEAIAPYVDTVSAAPLVGALPPPGKIVDAKELPSLGVTEWNLSNGIRVVMKPTDFKNDEILFGAFSPGGTSLVPDSEYVAALTASSVVEEGGLGEFDHVSLEKKLAGKIVNVSPYIGELDEGLSGGSSPQDITTMFQLAYLYFTAPRQDSSAYISYLSKMKAVLQNRSARPDAAFDDTLQVTLSQHNFRRRPFTEETLGEMNLKKSFDIYRNRFADAGDFTFVFVGNFTSEQLRPLILQYLGTLPSLHRHDHWRDVGVETPPSVVEKTVNKGIEPKSQVTLVFSGPFSWSQPNRFVLNALASVIRIKLREALREEKGATYGVGVRAAPIHFPREEYRITISFGCAPERVRELTRAVFQQVDSVQRFGVDEATVTKVKEIQRRERETQLRQNSFWLGALDFVYRNGDDPKEILTYSNQIASLTASAVQDAARRYFSRDRYVMVALYPQSR